MATRKKKSGPGAMGRFGLVLLAHPGRWLALVVLLTAGATWFAATRLQFNFSTHVLFTSNSKLARDYYGFVDRFGPDDTLIYLVVELEQPFTRENLARVARWTRELERLDRVETVFSLTQPLGGKLPLLENPRKATDAQIAGLRGFVERSKMYRGLLLSADGKIAGFVLQKKPRKEHEAPSATLVPELWKLVERIRGEKLAAYLTGIPVLEKEYIEHVQTDQARFLPIMLGLCTVLLLVLFRTWRVIVPVLAIFASVVWAAALLAACRVPIGITNNIITILILVVGTSDAIHLLARFYEEAERTGERDAGIIAALDAVGSACFLTTFTTACGFFSLVVIDNWSIRQLALFTPPALMLTFALVTTVIPLFLALTMPEKTPPGQNARRAGIPRPNSVYYSIARFNERLPWLVVALTLAVAGVSIFGLTRLKFRSNWMAMLNDANRLQQSNRFFERRMGGILPIELVLDSKAEGDRPLLLPAELARVARFEELLAADHELVPRNTFSAATVVLDLNQSSPYLQDKLIGLFGKQSQAEMLQMMQWYSEITSSVRRIPPQPGLVAKLFEGMGKLSADGKHLFNRYLDPGFQSARITLLYGDSSDEQMTARERRIEALFRESGLDRHFRLTVTGAGIHVSHAIEHLTRDILYSLVFVFLMVSVTFVVLFRSLSIGLISILPNAIPVLFSMGLMPFFGLYLNFSIAIIFAIGYGIAVDDTIHFLVRYLEHTRRGGVTQQEALAGTTVRTGRPMIYTSILLVMGFSVLFVSEFKTAHTLGTLGIVISIAALAGDLFFLPVLLALTRYAPGLDRAR